TAIKGWPLDRDPLPAHTVRNATVGGIRDARTAGIRPANAPIRMAAAMPPAHASTGITTTQAPTSSLTRATARRRPARVTGQTWETWGGRRAGTRGGRRAGSPGPGRYPPGSRSGWL